MVKWAEERISSLREKGRQLAPGSGITNALEMLQAQTERLTLEATLMWLEQQQ
jgi:hypothetical protein